MMEEQLRLESSEPLEAFRAEGFEPEIRLRAHDDYSILSMVEQGLGISILTELVLNKTSYNVAAVPIEPPIIRTMSIVVKDKKSLSLASRKFIKCLLDSRSELTLLKNSRPMGGSFHIQICQPMPPRAAPVTRARSAQAQ